MIIHYFDQYPNLFLVSLIFNYNHWKNRGEINAQEEELLTVLSQMGWKYKWGGANFFMRQAWDNSSLL